MVFCNNCGASVPPGSKFCQSCGAPVGAAAPAPGYAPGYAPLAPSIPPPPPPGTPYARPLQPASVVAYPTIPPSSDMPFSLQEGEVLYREIVPDPKLFWRLTLNIFGAAAAPIIFIVIIFGISFALAGVTEAIIAGGIIAAIFGICFVVGLFAAWIAYPKFRYWITNYRTVGRRGVVGYSIDSVPLETISDLVIYRGVLDRILGLSSLFIQPFGGGAGGGRRGGGISGVNTFLGLHPDDVPNIQHMVLHLRDVRRRETGRII